MYFPIDHHCTISSIKQNCVLFIHRVFVIFHHMKYIFFHSEGNLMRKIAKTGTETYNLKVYITKRSRRNDKSVS